MYTEEELKKLAEEEDSLTDEEILVLLAALHTTLSNLEKELSVFYQKYGKDGVVTYVESKKWVSSTKHIRRLVVLNQSISDVFAYGFTSFEQTFERHLTEIIKREAKFWGVELDIETILNTPWGVDELTGLQRLALKRKKWLPGISCDLKRSILRQDSILDVLTNVSKRGGAMEKDLKRLLRSEANAASSLARKQCFIEKGYKQYRFIHLDNCDCVECNNMHNRVFPIEAYEVGVTANPLHSNCRDRTEPVF